MRADILARSVERCLYWTFDGGHGLQQRTDADGKSGYTLKHRMCCPTLAITQKNNFMPKISGMIPTLHGKANLHWAQKNSDFRTFAPDFCHHQNDTKSIPQKYSHKNLQKMDFSKKKPEGIKPKADFRATKTDFFLEKVQNIAKTQIILDIYISVDCWSVYRYNLIYFFLSSLSLFSDFFLTSSACAYLSIA